MKKAMMYVVVILLAAVSLVGCQNSAPAGEAPTAGDGSNAPTLNPPTQAPPP